MRHFIFILVLTAFTIQTFNKVVIVFNYYTHTAVFAKNCENKAKPKLHCNGRCQMMKKLKQEENKDRQNPERRNDNKDEVLYFTKNRYDIQLSHIYVVITYPVFDCPPTKDVSLIPFKPPQIV